MPSISARIVPAHLNQMLVLAYGRVRETCPGLSVEEGRGSILACKASIG